MNAYPTPDALTQWELDYDDWLERVAEAHGEITPELAAEEEALNAERERIEGSLSWRERIDSVVRSDRNMALVEEGIADEIRVLQDRKKAIANARQRRKDRLQQQVDQATQGMAKRRCNGLVHIARIQKGPPSVVDEPGLDFMSLPPEFRNHTITLNKKAILAEHAKGEPLPEGIEVVQRDVLILK